VCKLLMPGHAFSIYWCATKMSPLAWFCIHTACAICACRRLVYLLAFLLTCCCSHTACAICTCSTVRAESCQQQSSSLISTRCLSTSALCQPLPLQ
jgi:hypothetical protein